MSAPFQFFALSLPLSSESRFPLSAGFLPSRGYSLDAPRKLLRFQSIRYEVESVGRARSHGRDNPSRAVDRREIGTRRVPIDL